jgi:hypothetical protein
MSSDIKFKKLPADSVQAISPKYPGKINICPHDCTDVFSIQNIRNVIASIFNTILLP